MPDDVLRIGSEFDVGPILAGSSQAASAVQSGCARMAESFQKSGMSADEASSALKNMGFSAQEVTAALGATAPAIDAVSAAADRSTRSFTNARIAGQGFMQEVGVRGPRVLTAFLAQSSTIGPILQAAFPVVAAIAFFEVLSMGYDKIISATSALVGWDEAAKKMYATQIQLNDEMVKFNANLEIEKLGTSLAGLKGAAKDAAELNNLYAERAILSKQNAGYLHDETTLLNKLAGNPRDVQVHNPESGQDEMARQVDPVSKDDAKQWNEQLIRVRASMEQITERLRTISEFKAPDMKAEGIAKASEEAGKYAEVLSRIYSEETKLTQEAAEKELRAFERTDEERERGDEEIAKRSAEDAQRDLAEFEKNLAQKQRLAQEYATRDVGDIGAAAEHKEKGVAAGSALGAGDPRLIEIATDAYNKQIQILDELVQKEHEIQATTKDSENPADREANLASLQRENALITQMDASYRKLQGTMQSVADNQQKSFQHSLASITSEFNHSFISWMNGSERFGRAMQHVWTGVVDTMASALLKMAEKMIVNVALQKGLMDGTKYSAAAKAARDTYASTTAIPIVGPFLAPEAAAVAFAAVMAFEHGGIVPRTDIAQVHKGEMVLPANISQSVQRAADQGTMGGGGHTFNYSPTIHGSSEAATKDMLENHGKMFVNYALREMRRKNFT
jgi:hypothetical protein